MANHVCLGRWGSPRPDSIQGLAGRANLTSKGEPKGKGKGWWSRPGWAVEGAAQEVDWEREGTDDEVKEDRVISLVELPDVVDTKGLVDNKGLGKSKDKVSTKGVGKVNSKVAMTDETDYMGENPWKVVVKRRVCRPPIPPMPSFPYDHGDTAFVPTQEECDRARTALDGGPR
jgi:hypothetical protein